MVIRMTIGNKLDKDETDDTYKSIVACGLDMEKICRQLSKSKLMRRSKLVKSLDSIIADLGEIRQSVSDK